MKKQIFRILCFLIILICILAAWNKVFKFKYGDGIYNLTKYYELDENSVDILFLGSSHSYQSFNTGTLWDEHGFSTYILGGALQPTWNTYYYLNEALKTQTPKLIVLEGYCTLIEKDYSSVTNIIKNNFGLKWSPEKIESLLISVPEGDIKDYLLEYMQYHSRYSEISYSDFLSNQGNPLYDNWKGYGCNTSTTPFESYLDVSENSERIELSEKTEKYYRKIIELAQEKGIPIMVVIAPYAGINDYEQSYFNKANDIADEMRVPFLNCNLYVDEIGLDYSEDAADNAHLNYRGSQKLTRYFGKYIASRYDIPDHRGEKEYSSWQNDADYIRRMINNQEIKEETEIMSLASTINNNDYWVIVSCKNSSNVSSKNTNRFLASLGIQEKEFSGISYLVSNKQQWISDENNNNYYTNDSIHSFHFACNYDDHEKADLSVVIDNEEFIMQEDSINIVIYDPFTEKIVDNFYLSKDDDPVIIRTVD